MNDPDGEELPRHDIKTEQAVLGAMMISADVLGECLGMLTDRSFLRPAHQIILEAMTFLADEGIPVDALTLKAELERRRQLEAVSGAPYLVTLMEAPPVAANGVHYARELLALQSQRDTERLSVQVRQMAADPSLSPRERMDAISAAVDALTDTAGGSETATAAELIGPLMDALERGPEAVSGIPSGWADLDRLVPGFRPGEVTVVGGRPGMGKSVILLNVAAHAAMRLGRTVLAVTLEMSRDEYMERLLAAEANVDLTRIRERALTDQDWDRVARAHGQISAADTLRIHEGPDLSVRGIEAELRAMRRAGRPADLLTVDYLQLMESSSGKPESRQLEVSGMSRSLKLLGKRWGIPVLVGSQLNRGPELRVDKRPLMADLRESGAVENDADIVILLYRDDAYVEDSPASGEIELIVAKNRQGPKATATLAFRGEVARCADLYREPGPGWTPASVLERQATA